MYDVNNLWNQRFEVDFHILFRIISNIGLEALETNDKIVERMLHKNTHTKRSSSQKDDESNNNNNTRNEKERWKFIQNEIQ